MMSLGSLLSTEPLAPLSQPLRADRTVQTDQASVYVGHLPFTQCPHLLPPAHTTMGMEYVRPHAHSRAGRQRSARLPQALAPCPAMQA